MKFYKKILSVIAVLTIILSVSSVNVFAATTTQNGLEVTLITDKSNYNSTDDIITTLTVKNTNDFEVTNLSLENIVPDGYKVTDENSLKKEFSKIVIGERSKLKNMDNTKKLSFEKIFLIIILLLSFIFILLFCLSHKTCYKYNDWFIIGNSCQNIKEKYGEFDIEYEHRKGYCIESNNTYHSEYYWMVIDNSNIVTEVFVSGVPGG